MPVRVALPGVPRREEVRNDGGLALADFLALPERTAKPRQRGVTHVIDRGLPIATLESLLEVSPPMLRGRIVADDVVAVVDDIPALCGAPVISVRRVVLDEILVRAAEEAGADVRTGTMVTGGFSRGLLRASSSGR